MSSYHWLCTENVHKPSDTVMERGYAQEMGMETAEVAGIDVRRGGASPGRSKWRKPKGNETQAAYARECVAKVEAEKIFGIILALTDEIADVLGNGTTDVLDLIEAKEAVVTETIDAQASQVMEETNAVNDAGSENTMIYSALQGVCNICFDTCVGRSEDQGACNTGCSGNTSEETVDMPVPQIQGQNIEVVKTTPRERASERDVEHIVDVPVPHVMEKPWR